MKQYATLIQWGVALVAIVLAFRWAYGLGYDAAELQHLKAEQSLIAESAKRAKALQKRLDKLPRAEGRIREIVRQYPAPCERPAPVADGLRKAIREANAARALPADS